MNRSLRTGADGAALAMSMFSVAPVRVRRTDRDAAGAAIALAPLVGALVGVLAGATARGVVALGGPVLLAGLLAVGIAAAATRGMHLDGLADLADGLGCYGPPERMLAVMRDPATGAFGVVTLVVTVGADAAALGVVTLPGAVVAFALGRVAFCWCARRGDPAASPDGLGASVAGTQRVWVAPVWTVVVATGAAAAVPGRWWQGPVAVGVGAVAAVALAAHAQRRLGGVSGDVFGGVCEVAVAGCLVVLALGS